MLACRGSRPSSSSASPPSSWLGRPQAPSHETVSETSQASSSSNTCPSRPGPRRHRPGDGHRRLYPNDLHPPLPRPRRNNTRPHAPRLSRGAPKGSRPRLAVPACHAMRQTRPGEQHRRRRLRLQRLRRGRLSTLATLAMMLSGSSRRRSTVVERDWFRAAARSRPMVPPRRPMAGLAPLESRARVYAASDVAFE